MSSLGQPDTRLAPAFNVARDGQSPYRPLDSARDEIRLVTILSPVSLEGDAICCTLSQMPLRDAPPYEALSYTWADENDDSSLSVTITLDGCSFQVTKNLAAALRQLRLPRSKRVFWIDAICIDQKNDPERNHQVAMMRTIYENADEVAIWLGSKQHMSHFAFVFLQGVLDRNDAVEWTQGILLNPELNLAVDALNMVILREYWNRIWIIQEVISASKKMIYCGSHSISWGGFREALNFISDQCQNLGTDRVTNPTIARLAITEGPKSIEKYWNLCSQGAPDLFSVLKKFRVNVSSDPRDKVYGVIGLTTARDDPSFTVDYSFSVGEVYVNVVKYIVTSSRSLDIISVEKSPLHPDWLPSWVPDWSYETGGDSPLGQQRFNATLGEAANALFESSGKVLRVQGMITGTIEFAAMAVDTEMTMAFLHKNNIGHERLQSHDFRLFLLILLDWCTLAMRRANYEPMSELAFFESIWSRKQLKRKTEELEIFFTTFAAAITRYMPDYPLDWLLGDSFLRLQNTYDDKDLPDVIKAGMQIFSWTAEQMRGRRLVVCSEGRMGLTPCSAEVGDLVCVLFGSSRPVILRPQDGHYIVIGSAYMRGLMYGEAIEGLSSGKYKSQEFELH